MKRHYKQRIYWILLSDMIFELYWWISVVVLLLLTVIAIGLWICAGKWHRVVRAVRSCTYFGSMRHRADSRYLNLWGLCIKVSYFCACSYFGLSRLCEYSDDLLAHSGDKRNISNQFRRWGVYDLITFRLPDDCSTELKYIVSDLMIYFIINNK